MDEKFGKAYRLNKKKTMETIFQTGKRLKSFPIEMRYITSSIDQPVAFQVVISVPKRLFKRAVDRNRLKRQIRDAVRRNKHILEESWKQNQQQRSFFLIYKSKKKVSYQKINQQVESLFINLSQS